jgi:hypothetical protein
MSENRGQGKKLIRQHTQYTGLSKPGLFVTHPRGDAARSVWKINYREAL